MNYSGEEITDKPLIAVTMATGLQGRGVVKELSNSRKFRIRAITRDSSTPKAKTLKDFPDVELFEADLLNSKSLQRAFENVYGIFGNTTPTKGWRPLVREYEIEQGRVLIDSISLVRSKGDLKHIVFSSICKAKDPLKNNPAPSHFSSKWDIEEYLSQKKLNDITTILRPASYFENFDSSLPGLKITDTSFPGVVQGDRIWQTIAVEDIGKWAYVAFNNPKKFINYSLNLAGEELTGNQMAHVMQKFLGNKTKKVQYKMAPRLLMKLFVHDIGVMADWIERAGYGANLDNLKLIAKEEGIEMTSLSNWLSKKYENL